jgi:hypothetical protein
MSEFQYSSIMDYGGRFNADFHGIGHYDVAALASGYGDLVEVFDEEAMAGMQQGGRALGVDVRQAALDANRVRNPILNQGIENALPYQNTVEGLMLAHYTNFPAMFGGHQNIAKRRLVPRSDYLASLESQDSSSPVKVPYLSCYDEFVDSVDICHRWDLGADPYEIVANNLTAYREYYVFNNFQRDRVGFDSFQVLQRVLSRYFLPLTNMYQHWLWNWGIVGLTPTGTPKGDLGAIATREGLNRLLNTISMPEYGAHIYDEATGAYQPVGGECPEVPGEVSIPINDNGVTVDAVDGVGAANFMTMPSCVNVPRGVGRSLFSRYDTSGYDVFRRITESGNFYEQTAALIALQTSDASVVGIGQDVNADARTFRIPYNLLFAEDVENLTTSLYNENDAGYAQHIQLRDGVGQVLPHSVFGEQSPDQVAQLPLIAPGRTYTTRVQALVAGMNLLDAGLNPAYAKRGQISLLGSGEVRTAPEGFETVEVGDPKSGRSFVAYRKVGDPAGVWYAAELLEKAQTMIANGAEDFEIEGIFSDIELVRLAYSVFSDD